MTFTILTFSQLGHALAIRSNKESIKAMAAAIVFTFLLQIIVLFTPVHEIFDLKHISFKDFLIAISLSSIVFWAVEVEKLVKRIIRQNDKTF